MPLLVEGEQREPVHEGPEGERQVLGIAGTQSGGALGVLDEPYQRRVTRPVRRPRASGDPAAGR